MAPLAIIVAMTASRVIGRQGALPWRLPEDLKRFKRITLGHVVLMGRVTHESIGRPLPGRRNIVVTSQPERVLPGCEAASNLEEAVAQARTTDSEPHVIGGSRLYAEALPHATRLYITRVLRETEGDTWFPAFDLNDWVLSEEERGEGAVYQTLDRKQ